MSETLTQRWFLTKKKKKKDSSPTFMTVYQIHHLNLHLFCVYYLKNKGVNKEKDNCISLKKKKITLKMESSLWKQRVIWNRYHQQSLPSTKLA